MKTRINAAPAVKGLKHWYGGGSDVLVTLIACHAADVKSTKCFVADHS